MFPNDHPLRIVLHMASTPSRRTEDGPFQVKWRPSATAPWQSCSFDDEALAWQAKRVAEDHNHRITREKVYEIVLKLPEPKPVVDGLTFAEWAETWLKRKKGVDKDTLDGYEGMLRKHLMPFFGAMGLRAIDEDDIADWIAKQEVDLSATTIAHQHALLHQVLGDAVPKHLDRNPAARATGKRGSGLPKAEVPFEAVYLTRAEADLILGVCPDAIRDLVRTKLGTGMRLGELVVLRVQDVKLDGDQPSITVGRALKRNGRIGAPKSRMSRRTITISRALAEVLRPRLLGRAADALVFPSPMGKLWSENNLNGRYWKRAIASASHCAEHPPATKLSKRGKPLADPYARSLCSCAGRLQSVPRLHDLRHTHAGWLLDKGWDLHKLQLRLGHESIKTTVDRYGPRKRDVATDDLDDIDL